MYVPVTNLLLMSAASGSGSANPNPKNSRQKGKRRVFGWLSAMALAAISYVCFGYGIVHLLCPYTPSARANAMLDPKLTEAALRLNVHLVSSVPYGWVSDSVALDGEVNGRFKSFHTRTSANNRGMDRYSVEFTPHGTEVSLARHDYTEAEWATFAAAMNADVQRALYEVSH